MGMIYVCRHCLSKEPPVEVLLHMSKRLDHLKTAHQELFEDVDENDETEVKALITNSFMQEGAYNKIKGDEVGNVKEISDLDLPPGEWFVRFIENYGGKHNLTLDDEEKMVVKDIYREMLPSASEFAYLLQNTFGIKDTVRIQRLVWVYDHFLREYVEHNSEENQGTRAMVFPRPSIKVGSGAASGGYSDLQQSFLKPQMPSVDSKAPHTFPDQMFAMSVGANPSLPSTFSYGAPDRGPPDFEGLIANAVSNAINKAIEPITYRLNRIEDRNNGSDVRGGSSEMPYRPLGRATTLPIAAKEIVDEEDPRLRVLSQQIETLTSNMEQLRAQQADEQRRKKEQEERESLLRDINANVKDLVTRELGPLAAEVQNIKNIIPSNALANLGITDLLQLNREIREGAIQSRTLDLAEEKYRDQQQGATSFRNELISGIKSFGDAIGEAVGATIRKNIDERQGTSVPPPPRSQTNPGGLIIPTPTEEGMVQFTCQQCGKTITADPNTDVAVCLSCGTKYALHPVPPQSAMPPSTKTESPPPSEHSASKGEGESAAKGKITLVPRGGESESTDMTDMPEMPS